MSTIILSIETATNICSVALHENGELVAVEENNSPNSHSAVINTAIECVLVKANLSLNNLNAICISKGPGSYTGLRIGLSTAKGLCYALNIPLISIDTLLGMYIGALETNPNFDYYIPMIDARRNEVYCSIFHNNGTILKKSKAEILNINSFNETINMGKTLFTGNGSQKFIAIIGKMEAKFNKNILPSSSYFGKYALQQYSIQNFENVAYFEPYYLKEFYSVPTKKITLVQ